MGSVMGNPMTALLAIIGIVLLGAGVLFDEGVLVVMGPSALLLAVLVSIVSEFLLGPDGVSVKFRDSDRETAFRNCAETLESSLTRLAAALSDDPAPLVDEALDRAYVEWDGDARLMRLHALCTVTRCALASARVEGREPPYRKAVLHLHYDQDLELERVALMLGLPVDEVRRHAEEAGVAAP